MRPNPRYALLLSIVLATTYVQAQNEVVDADNGISVSGSGATRKVFLGGTLTGNTTIPFGGFNLMYSGTGNIGIRTTNPLAPLHVTKSVTGNFDPTAIVEDTYTVGYTMLQLRGTGQVFHLGVGNHSETALGLANKFFIWDNTVGAARLVVNSTGQVGIGTNSPGSILDVNGASRFRNNLTADFGTTNRRAQLRDNGLYMTRTSDGQYLASITSDGNMDFNTRNHHRFFSDGVEIVSLMNGGNVGIGNIAPTQKLQVNGTVYSTGFKLDAGNSLFWADPNTHITRNGSSELELQEYTGAFRFKSVNPAFNLVLEHATNGSVSFTLPSAQTFAINNKGAKILETSAPNQSNVWIKLGASAAQYTDGPGTALYLFGGIGGTNGVQNGGNVYIDGGAKGSASAQNGNIVVANTTGNLLVGTTTDNGEKVQVNGDVSITSNAPHVETTRHPILVGDESGAGYLFHGHTAGLPIYFGSANGNNFRKFFFQRQGQGGDDAAAYNFVYNSAAAPALQIFNYAQGITKMLVTSGGNLVINNGTTDINSNYKLQVTGTTYTTGFIMPTGAAAGKVLTSDANGNATWEAAAGGSANAWVYGGNAVSGASQIGNTSNQTLQIITNNVSRIHVAATGEVGIGTSAVSSSYKLSVEGSVRARKVRVDQATWPDYVFHPSYSLRPLSEVEAFIKNNSHLPDVPSAAEVKKEGIDLGDNQAVLLKKIEELTLYIIEQNKRLEAVEKELKDLKKK